jgi:hypothetical protein
MFLKSVMLLAVKKCDGTNQNVLMTTRISLSVEGVVMVMIVW